MVSRRLSLRKFIPFLVGYLCTGVISQECKCIPGDDCWPDPSEWAKLNASISGNLIKNQPIAGVCYTGKDWSYDAEKCAFVNSNWNNAALQLNSPIGYQYPRDLPCPPVLNETYGKCSLGDSPVYTINATHYDHISEGIRFAREKRLRLVIRSTGHDMLGRSTGFGSLQIWVRYLRTGIDYSDSFSLSTPLSCASVPRWYGPSIRIGGGYEWGEVYKVAAALDKIIVGGAVPNVGCIGGWLQGAGHSLVSHDYGLGADQLLEAKVVLADGNLVTANACHNPSLFRAIRGGGPAYGVVVSGTWKAYPTQSVTTHTMTFAAETANDIASFLSAVEGVYKNSVHILNHGFTGYGVWSTSGRLTNPPLEMPTYTHTLLGLGKSEDQAVKVLAPLIERIRSLSGVRFVESAFNGYPTYAAFQGNSLFTNSSAPAGLLVAWGSRLLDRRALHDTAALRHAIETLAGDASQGAMNGLIFVGGGKVFTADRDEPKTTSVLPAWRRTYVHALVQRMWTQETLPEDVEALQNDITNVKTAALVKLAPDTGAYMNEADLSDAEWRKDFYGENYKMLQNIKDLYDPDGIFYCSTCVSAERWAISERGTLCQRRRN